MKTFLLKLLILFVPINSMQAQQNLAGTWKGILTQDQGGYSPNYEFEIYLIQKGNIVKGRSYVTVGDIFASMELVGELHGGIYLQLVETSIVDRKINPGMEWCLKISRLILKKQTNGFSLEGFWEGKTSFSPCVPGKIKLVKIQPRV